LHLKEQKDLYCSVKGEAVLARGYSHLTIPPYSNTIVLEAFRKTQGFKEINLKHPSLQTHAYISLKGPRGEKVFEAYAQKIPAAFRVFWY
jgi:hypothetical protein